MRVLLFLVISCMPSVLFGQNLDSNRLKIPIKVNDGYGPFGGSLAAVSFEDNRESNPWFKTYRAVKGIPSSWKNVKKAMIWLDAHQFVYQNYIRGNISTDRYKDLQTSWQWTPNKETLSEKPVQCFVYIISGEDVSGRKG